MRWRRCDAPPASRTITSLHPVPRQNQNGRLVVDPFLTETTESTRAGDALSTRSRAGIGLSRTPRTCARESRAPPATARAETHGQASTSPEARSVVLDRLGQDVAELARGARACPARHRGAMAPRMAPPALDAAIGADSRGPSEDRRRHSYADQEDGCRESTLGSASDPWRVGPGGHRGL